MTAEQIEWKPTRRDELIGLARYGKVTPQEAEAEARAKGFEPFERRPALPAFDPMLEPRWTIVQAIAWIAWRDLQQVRENCPEFRSKCTRWLFRHWNECVANGTVFVPRAGWFLETWRESTTARLALDEIWRKAHQELPATRQMTISEAQQSLWRALAEAHLMAEALNADRQPVDIPAREWSYLKLYEDGKKDALKYDPLDRREPFTDVKFKRDDLLRLWPPVRQREEIASAGEFIDALMLEPMESPGTAGYVPLCAALHWIMTRGGTARVRIDDEKAWASAVAKLRPLLASGDFDVIGLPGGGGLSEIIPSTTMALIRILPPLSQTLGDLLLSSPSHIDCSCYLGDESWIKHFSDRLYVSGKPSPVWTHLQVRKAGILRCWPRSGPTAKAGTSCLRWLTDQMRENPTVRPKSKAALWTEAKRLFPSLSRRQFNGAWESAVTETGATQWSKAGRPKESQSKSIRRRQVMT